MVCVYYTVYCVGSLTGRNGKGVYVYFVANFSKEPVSFGTWSDGHLSPNASVVGKHCGAFAGNGFHYTLLKCVLIDCYELYRV